MLTGYVWVASYIWLWWLLFLLVTQSVIYSSWLTWRPQLGCKCGVHDLLNYHLCVDLLGLLRRLPVFVEPICEPLRFDARTSDVAAAAWGCRKYSQQPHNHILLGLSPPLLVTWHIHRSYWIALCHLSSSMYAFTSPLPTLLMISCGSYPP